MAVRDGRRQLERMVWRRVGVPPLGPQGRFVDGIAERASPYGAFIDEPPRAYPYDGIVNATLMMRAGKRMIVRGQSTRESVWM